jgi:hypothetical protein
MRTILQQQQQQLDNDLTAIDPPKPFFLSSVPIDSSNINPRGGEMVVWIDERINVIPQPKAVFNQKKKRGSGGGGDGYFLPFTLAGWWGLHKLVIKR